MSHVPSRRAIRPNGRVLRLATGALAAAVLLVACGDGDVEDAPADDETTVEEEDEATDDDVAAAPAGDTEHLRVRSVRPVQSIDPAIMPGRAEDEVLDNIFEGLVAYEPGSDEVVLELAETFESSDDGLEHRFVLKEGIQFQGGYGEVTAEDVKFSFERVAGLTEPVLESSYVGDWATLEEVEVVDTYEGIIRLSEPFAPLMTTTLPNNAGKIVSKDAVEELGEDFNTQPIGTGPYEVVEHSPGQHVVLERFEDYGGAADYVDAPQWESITFVTIEDDSAADIALESGELDFSIVSASGISRFEEDDDNFETYEQTTLDYGWVGMNVEDEVLSDINIRRAIRSALDVDGMIAAGFEGRVSRADALIAPDNPIGYWEDAPRYDQDLEQAEAYLAEAGVDGSDLALTMTINEQAGSRAIAEITQANLAQLGIDVQIDLVDDSEFLDAGSDGTLQLFYQSFSNNADPSWATVWFSCDQVGDWNWMQWCDEEFQELHEAALVESGQDVRHDHYVEMQQIMDEDAVAAWVMYRTNLYAYANDLEPSLAPARALFNAWDFRR